MHENGPNWVLNRQPSPLLMTYFTKYTIQLPQLVRNDQISSIN